MRDLSSRLAQVPFSWLVRGLRGSNDRGAIGVLVTVFIAAGVLFGMGALVIDVGRLYQNKAELQSGADAGALAVAVACGTGSADCQSQAQSQAFATNYADENASALTGGTNGVQTICGYSTTGITVGSGPCGSVPPSCPKNPASGNYVDVQTKTELPNTHTLLPPIFAQTLVPGYNGTKVLACAQATWGPNDKLGFTICKDAAPPANTSIGLVSYSNLVSNPQSAVNAKQDEITLTLHNTGGNGCDGTDGNFGWTATCPLIISGTTYAGNTGKSDAGACNNQIDASYASGNTAYNTSSTQQNWDKAIVYIPLYSATNGLNGNNTLYTLNSNPSFIAFVITSYWLPSGGKAGDWLSTGNGKNNTCSPNGCISGFFVDKPLPPSDAGSKLIG